jgi:hypothetical protein
MKPVYLTQSQLKNVLDSIPTSEHLNIALCSVPTIQINGITCYESRMAAEALSKYYRGKAAENWKKDHREPLYMKTSYYAGIAEGWLAKARAIEQIMLKWEAQDEDHQTVL